MTILAIGKNLYLKQGDTGNVYFNKLPKDKPYDVYLSVYDPDTNNILNETQATTYTQATGQAYFGISEDFSNGLPVGDWEYGLKICYDGTEDTVLPRAYLDESGALVKEAAPKITVDYKYVEGA